MKLNIAFRTLLAAICTASHARARATSYLRDPRTVEEKEQVQRQTMGEHISSTMLGKDAGGVTCKVRLVVKEKDLQNNVDLSPEEVKSLACSAVAKDFEVCRGCQGYSKMGKGVHIPGCVGMAVDDCMKLAMAIVKEKPTWFKDGLSTQLYSDQFEIIDAPELYPDPLKITGAPASEMTYYMLGLPVSEDSVASDDGSRFITGIAGDCMVHYSWDWCVPLSSNGETATACIKLPPWDCSAVGGGCLSANECCARIQDGEYPKPDINNNELQCYEWKLPVKSSGGNGGNGGSGGSSGSGNRVGNRLVIHVGPDGKVSLPAMITDVNYEVVHDEEIIVPKDEEENIVPQQTCTTGYPSFPDDLNSEGTPLTLQSAAEAYVNEDCTNNPNCLIGQQWGYPINSWCVEKVTSFVYLFYYMQTFNEDINGWTTSQVTDMNIMFSGAMGFNQPLNNWDTSSVTKMQSMFHQAKAFNQPLNSWNVSSVAGYGMAYMFKGAVSFNQPLNNWDVSQVFTMEGMFQDTVAFNQPLNNWDVSSVTNMQSMLRETAFNQPLDSWNVSSVTTTAYMFYRAEAFNQPLDNWDLSSVTNMYAMFYVASVFNQNLCPFGKYYDSELYSMHYDSMFKSTSCPKTGNPTSTDGPWCYAC